MPDLAHTLEKKYPDLSNIRFPSLDDEVSHESPQLPSLPPAGIVLDKGDALENKIVFIIVAPHDNVMKLGTVFIIAILVLSQLWTNMSTPLTTEARLHFQTKA